MKPGIADAAIVGVRVMRPRDEKIQTQFMGDPSMNDNKWPVCDRC
jgi:hypothetical protein